MPHLLGISQIRAKIKKKIWNSGHVWGDERPSCSFPITILVARGDDAVDGVPQKYFIEMCHTHAIPCLDLLPLLQQEPSLSRAKLFYDFCHMTKQGHEVVVRHVLEWIRSAGLV